MADVIIFTPDPSQVLLQVVARNLDGSPKTSLTSADVRVYHMDAGAETEDLATTALSQVGATSVWRYRWLPISLSVDHYVIEYTLIDSDGIEWIGTEDLIVEDIAQEATLVAAAADVELIKKIEVGRWKIVGNQMIFYDENEVTPLLTFDLKDAAGSPTMSDVFERVPNP